MRQSLSIIPEETQAILIGTSEYPKDSSLCPLPGVVNNVNDLADLLCDIQLIGIPRANITKLLNETHPSAVTAELASKAKAATDTLIVYYAGHGLPRKGSHNSTTLFLAVCETTSDNTFHNAIEINTIQQAISNSPATKKILIIDSCYAALALPKMSDLASFIQTTIDDMKGAYTIASVAKQELADAPDGERHTAFSGQLIQSLQHGISKQEPYICLEDLFNHIRAQLIAKGFPEPQRSVILNANQLRIAKNRQYQPIIDDTVIFIGSSDQPTTQLYQDIAQQCVKDSFSQAWSVLTRTEACVATQPNPDRSEEIVKNCGVYIALLGYFYGEVYESLDLSHTAHELQIARTEAIQTLIFLLPEVNELPPLPPQWAKSQYGLQEKQEELKQNHQNNTEPHCQVYRVSSPEDLKSQLQQALAEIQTAQKAQESRTTHSLDTPAQQPSQVPFIGDYTHLSYDRQPVFAHTIQELDTELIDYFLNQPQAQDRLSENNLLRATQQQHLQYLGLGHDNHPSFGTFLCFAPSLLLIRQVPACSLHLSVFDHPNRGDAQTSPKKVQDNLLNLYQIGLYFFREQSGLGRTGKVGSEARDDLEIPEAALKEAMANALIHRDYEHQPDLPTHINVHPDRIEIISYGEAAVDFQQPPEEIPSYPRNHDIADIFRLMQRAELKASGISRMHSAMRAAKLPPPIIKTIAKPPTVKVVFRRPQKAATTSDTEAAPEIDFTLKEIFTGPSLLKPNAPFQAPPLPSYFVDRPEHRNVIKAYVLSRVGQTTTTSFRTSTPGTLVVSAIYGLGGIGKTVLATAIAHDRDIHAQFPDGIFWVTLGQNPDLLTLLSSWIQTLGDYTYRPLTADAASTHLQTQLYDKRALLIVDDVWNPDHAEYFRVGGAQCCVLVTTRQAQIAGATRYDLDVMTQDQSLKLMSQALGERLIGHDADDAQALAGAVGHLPLALELATARVEEGVTWSEMLNDLKEELTVLDRSGSDMIDEAKRRNHSLIACFNLSLKQLTERQREQFYWLGIYPEDVTITQDMVATLWNVKPNTAGSILRTLRAKALLLSGGRQLNKKPGFRMHDLMHDFAQTLIQQSPKPESERDLPGLGLTIPKAHQHLLETYQLKTQDGGWPHLPNDGYIYANLTWHLQQAQQEAEIHALLQLKTPEGHNAWYEACDAIGQSTIFVNDVARAWAIADTLIDHDPHRAIVLQFRYALIKTSLNSMAKGLPIQLMTELVKKEVWQPAQGLAYIQQLQNPQTRVNALEALIPLLPASLLPKALEITHAIEDPFLRALALIGLGYKMPELLSEAIEVARAIQDEESRASAFSALAPQLPPELLPKAIKVARDIQDKAYRAYALCALAPQLTPELIPKAIKVARDIQDESYRAYALCALAPQLTPELLPKAIDVIRDIQDEASRASALCALTPQLPGLLPETIDVIRDIQDEDSRAYALCALAPQLTPELLPKAIDVIRDIQDEDSRAYALCALVPQLTPELLPKAIDVIRDIQDEDSRAYALRDLAPQLTPELLIQAIEITRTIQGEESRAYALSDLAPQLTPELLPQAIEITRTIQDEESRAYALSKLAPQLTLGLLSQAIEVARDIQDEAYRAYALSDLAPQLAPELLPQAIEVARDIQDEASRAYALCALAHETPELLPEAIEVARAIQDEDSRASALSTLAPQLTPELRPQAIEATRAIQDKAYRASALRAIAHEMPELLPEAIEVTRDIQNEAYRASALSDLVPQLTPELLPQAIEVTRSIQDEDSRAYALRAITPQLTPELLSKAIEVTRAIQDEACRAHVLSALAPQMPELIPQTIDIIRDIQDEESRAYALSKLAPQLTPELLPQAIEVTRNIQTESSRASALCALAPQLTPELLPQAIEITRDIQSESSQASALCALAPQLTPELLPQAIEITKAIQDEDSQAYALRDLAPQQPELLQLAIKVTRDIQDEDSRAYALRDLAPQLTPELLSQAIEVTRDIQAEDSRAYALSALAPQLTLELLPQAIEVTRDIQDEDSRAYALSALAPHLTSELLPQAIEVTRDILDESYRASALCALAPQMPELLPQAIRVIRDIQDEASRAYVLSVLAPQLTPELLPQAIKVTREIQSEPYRASALSALASQLTPELLLQAIDITREIQSESYRAYALRALAPQLTPELLTQAIEVTREMQSESSQASALRALAPQLTPELLPEAIEVTRNIQDDASRASALRALALQMPELLPEAIEVTRNIQDDASRASALSALATQLTPELLPEILNSICNIQSEATRVLELNSLVSNLQKALLQSVLERIYSLQNEYYRASALFRILPYLEHKNKNIDFLSISTKILSALDRKKLIQKAPFLAQIILNKYGKETLQEVVDTIKEISIQWP